MRTLLNFADVVYLYFYFHVTHMTYFIIVVIRIVKEMHTKIFLYYKIMK